MNKKHNVFFFRFVMNFRLSKDAFVYVLDKIQNELPRQYRSSSIPNQLKLATTLNLLATGSYQNGTGQHYKLAMNQQSVSKVFNEVLRAIERIICPAEICLRMTDDEKRDAKVHFMERSGVPGVIGAVDGTHIQIRRPATSEHLFANRKAKHSLNVMVVSILLFSLYTLK